MGYTKAMKLKNFIRPLLVTLVVLLGFFVAMQMTDEVNWSAADFVIMGGLLFSFGFGYELLAVKFRKPWQRVVIGVTLLAVLLYFWAELAVGIFTNFGR